jgi:hypothetical protein
MPVKKDNKVEITHVGSGKTLTGTILEVSSTPESAEAINQSINNEWILKQLQLSGYVYPAVVKLDKTDDSSVKVNDIANISITTESVKPTSFIFN